MEDLTKKSTEGSQFNALTLKCIIKLIVIKTLQDTNRNMSCQVNYKKKNKKIMIEIFDVIAEYIVHTFSIFSAYYSAYYT